GKEVAGGGEGGGVGEGFSTQAEAQAEAEAQATARESIQRAAKPWLGFPEGEAWPVVRCRVKGLRHFFPDVEERGKRSNRSVVTQVRLEVTGVVAKDNDKGNDKRRPPFPWVSPDLVAYPRTTSDAKIDFVVYWRPGIANEFILPCEFYVKKVTMLEKALVWRKVDLGKGSSAEGFGDPLSVCTMFAAGGGGGG
ncbi:hypothetical protein ScalyP_jg4403, partial [Parmales sp. scaly parma]